MPRIVVFVLMLFVATSATLLQHRKQKYSPSVIVFHATMEAFAGLTDSGKTFVILLVPPTLYFWKRKSSMTYGALEWCIGLVTAASATADMETGSKEIGWIKLIGAVYLMSRACQNIYEGIQKRLP